MAAQYYLIRGDDLIADLTAEGAITALPLLQGGLEMSLINGTHVQALATHFNVSLSDIADAMGLTDLRGDLISTVFLSHDLGGQVPYPAYYIAPIGDYALYQVLTTAEEVLELHNILYAQSPASTLGALAKVDVYGTSFALTAVRAATGMSAFEALARRDRIADYLDTLGKSTVALRAATNEDTQMLAIATALGIDIWAGLVNL